MPVNAALKNLARDGRFSLDDAKQLKQLVQEGKVSKAEAKETLSRYGDIMDAEAGQLLEGFTGGQRGGTMQGLAPETLGKNLRTGSPDAAGVKDLQRGLMAVGMRDQDAGLALAAGADGIFGAETKAAVQAFQSAHGISPTGKADPVTLKALDAALKGNQPSPTALPPAPTAQQPKPTRGLGAPAPEAAPAATSTTKPGTPDAVVKAAQGLVDGPTAKNYGVAERWVNNDPRHAAPTGKPINGTADKWKCNLFAGNTIAAAGFEPPYYGNKRSGGEYPNANQLYKWSDKYAAKYGNQPRFALGDEMRDMQSLSADDRKARMNELLSKLKPGDLLIVGHNTSEVADGGHCRVFLGKAEDGTYKFAQASKESAVVKNQTADDLMNEKDAWILRPNTPRR